MPTVAKRQEVPPPLDLVEAFLNTADLEQGSDQLSTPTAVRQWLVARKLIEPSQKVTEPNRRQAIRLREALRHAAAANNGASVGGRTLQDLNQLAGRGQLKVAFGHDGRARLEPSAQGFESALARILAAVTVSMFTGSWIRLKACANDGCQWAFYDASKNRSGRWCEMADCGNDAKGRAFRARQSRARSFNSR